MLGEAYEVPPHIDLYETYYAFDAESYEALSLMTAEMLVWMTAAGEQLVNFFMCVEEFNARQDLAE